MLSARAMQTETDQVDNHDPRREKTSRKQDAKTLDAFKADLTKVRTGRATGLLDHVMVDYYGNPTR